jgi:hypothetical protein
MGQTGKGSAAQGFRPDETRLRGTFICQSALHPILGRRSQRPNRLLYAGSTRLRQFCFSARMPLPMHKPEVDLALVLAVYTSSMDIDEVDLTNLLGGGELHRWHNAISRHYFIPPALAAFSPLEALWSKLPCRRSLPCETPIPSAGWPRS